MRKAALIFGALALVASVANVGVILFNENPLPINGVLAVTCFLTGVGGIILGTGKDL